MGRSGERINISSSSLGDGVRWRTPWGKANWKGTSAETIGSDSDWRARRSRVCCWSVTRCVVPAVICAACFAVSALRLSRMAGEDGRDLPGRVSRPSCDWPRGKQHRIIGAPVIFRLSIGRLRSLSQPSCGGFRFHFRKLFPPGILRPPHCLRSPEETKQLFANALSRTWHKGLRIATTQTSLHKCASSARRTTPR